MARAARHGSHVIAARAAGSAERLATRADRVPRGRRRRRRAASRAARETRARENICASSDRSCRCCSVACSGTSSTNTCDDRLAVGRVERDRRARRRTNAPRASLEALDAAVRNRDALAEPGRAQLLARREARRRRRARRGPRLARTARRPRRTAAPSIATSRSSSDVARAAAVRRSGSSRCEASDPESKRRAVAT